MTMSAPKHPSTEEWIKNMEYYKNEIVPFTEMWMDIETLIQSEVSQKE